MIALVVVALAAAEPVDGDAAHAGPTVDGEAELWVAFDSNAKRLPNGSLGQGDPGRIEPTPKLPPPVADGLVQADASLTAVDVTPSLSLRSETLIGAKQFFTQWSESMLAGQTRATLSSSSSLLPAGAVLTMSVLAKGRVQLDLTRSYGLLDATTLLDEPVLDWLVLRAGLHGDAFHSFDIPLFSDAGAGLLAGVHASRGPESLELLVDAGARGFPFSSKNLLAPDQIGADPQLREDGVITTSLTATSARALYLSIAYALTRNASNARGESYTRHRVTALVGFRLPADVDCTAEGALQLTQYDDGVSIGQVYFLQTLDQENENVLAVTLSRQLLGPVSAVAAVSFMANEFAVEGARFSRQTAAIGIRGDF
jgi:hypothetical protein